MAVALQMLRRMHRRLTSAKPFLWDPTRAVPAARLARPCWHDLRVVFTARPWPWATTTHKADTHKLNTMHRLELLDQELARTWGKTLPCRLRRSSAARLSHGTDIRAGVATHNFHMADRHKWHTMCLPLRCWAKQRAGTVGTLFRRIAMLTKPFLQVFCMVGSSFGAWLAATSTAWWICACGTPCACLCVLRQGAATVHTFSLTAMAAVRRVSAALAIALHCALSAALAAAVRLGACIVAPVMVGYLL